MFVDETIPAIRRSSRARQQYLFSALECCKSVGNLAKIHTQIVVNGFTQKNFILVKLLSLYIAFGFLEKAQKVFEDISVPSTSAWNQMIRAQSRSETPQNPIEIFKRMAAAEVEPDGFTYSCLLSACARSRLFREGKQIHGRVLANGYSFNTYIATNLVNLYANGGGGEFEDFELESARCVFDEMFERNVVAWNSLLAGYVRRGDFDAARKIFDDMPERNVRSWTTMVAGYAQNGQCKQALFLFHAMRRARVELDQVALVAAVSACAELGDLKTGTWIHRYIEKAWRSRHQPVLVSLSNALIHMYASCGVIDEAYKLFDEMPHRNTVSWSSIITGFAKQGNGEEAIRVFKLMLCSARPDEITFIGVLTACSHAGFISHGLQLFHSMNETFRISPQIEHFGCMIDLLSRAGLLSEALRLIESMPMKPNNAVWGALLNGCRIHKNYEIAAHVAKQLAFGNDPNEAAGYLMLLSDVYARDRRWREVATLRQDMIEMGVKKPAGRSWIQINGAVHDFVAGDETHKNVILVYEMLGNITRQARTESQNPDESETFLGD